MTPVLTRRGEETQTQKHEEKIWPLMMLIIIHLQAKKYQGCQQKSKASRENKGLFLTGFRESMALPTL